MLSGAQLPCSCLGGAWGVAADSCGAPQSDVPLGCDHRPPPPHKLWLLLAEGPAVTRAGSKPAGLTLLPPSPEGCCLNLLLGGGKRAAGAEDCCHCCCSAGLTTVSCSKPGGGGSLRGGPLPICCGCRCADAGACDVT